MKYKGRLFVNLNSDRSGLVKDAVITPNRICIDWNEDGRIGHLDTDSLDGVRFQGKYGYSSERGRYSFHLRLHKAKEEILLFGTWLEQGRKGVWAFHLTRRQPAKSPAKAKQANVPRREKTKPSKRVAPQSLSKPRASSAKPTHKTPAETTRQSTCTPASALQIEEMVALAVPVHAARQCSYEEAAETIQSLRAARRRIAERHPSLSCRPSQLLSAEQSPKGSSVGNPSRANDSHAGSLLAVQIPDALLNVAHGRKYTEGNKWVLTTKKGVRMATFENEDALDEWWVSFQRGQGRSPLPLGVGVAPRVSNNRKIKRTSKTRNMRISAASRKQKRRGQLSSVQASKHAVTRRGLETGYVPERRTRSRGHAQLGGRKTTSPYSGIYESWRDDVG